MHLDDHVGEKCNHCDSDHVIVVAAMVSRKYFSMNKTSILEVAVLKLQKTSPLLSNKNRNLRLF